MKTVNARVFSGGYKDLPVADLSHFRPSVYGLLIHENKILLMKNRNASRLSLPGGGIELGETNEEALLREIKEETGIEAQVNQLLAFDQDFFYYDPKNIFVHTFLFFYACTPLTTTPHADDAVEDEESEKPRWIDIDSLSAEDFISHGDQILSFAKTTGWQ